MLCYVSLWQSCRELPVATLLDNLHDDERLGFPNIWDGMHFLRDEFPQVLKVDGMYLNRQVSIPGGQGHINHSIRAGQCLGYLRGLSRFHLHIDISGYALSQCAGYRSSHDYDHALLGKLKDAVADGPCGDIP